MFDVGFMIVNVWGGEVGVEGSEGSEFCQGVGGQNGQNSLLFSMVEPSFVVVSCFF